MGDVIKISLLSTESQMKGLWDHTRGTVQLLLLWLLQHIETPSSQTSSSPAIEKHLPHRAWFCSLLPHSVPSAVKAHTLQSVLASCQEHLPAPQEIMQVSSLVLHSHLLFFQETCSSGMTVTHGLGADGRAATLTSCQIPRCFAC